MTAGFIGRDRELAELLAGLEDALRGRGRVFLIVGEAGVGKTVLADQLAELAVQHGARAHWGRAWDGGGAPPYWLWAQIIRGLASAHDDEDMQRYLSLPGLAVLVPELAERVGGNVPAPGSLDSDRGRFALFESVARFLSNVSALQPLVLVLDDILAGDRASLLLLRFIAREIRSARVLVIATCRDIEAAHSPEGIELLADLVRDGHVLSLRGLDREEVGRLITEVTDTLPWPGKVAAIHDATAGNPLFVREVARLLAAADPLDRPGPLSIPIPPSVRAVISQRLAILSAEAVAALSAGAVIGRDFGLALVEAACELPRERVVASLAEALALGTITQPADAVGSYRFSHPLIREVIYEGLPSPARLQMHRQIGEAIERLYGDAGGYLADLAFHFSRLTTAGDAAKALRFGRAAGDRAMQAWAYEEASVMYRRALEALEHTIFEDDDACDLLLRLGGAQTRAGEYQEAKQSYVRAAEIARKLGDHERLAAAALGYGEHQVQGGTVNRELVGLLQEALEALAPGDTPLRARLLARLSLELTFSEETGRRDVLSREALEMARRIGEPASLTSALRARWLALWGPDGLAERTALGDEMLNLALATSDPETEALARSRRITCALEIGDIRTVDFEMATLAKLAAELRMPFHEWTAATLRAMREVLRGSLAEGETLADAALSLQHGRLNAAAARLYEVTLVRWEQGRLGELRDAWHNFIEQFPRSGFGSGWLSLANAEAGRSEEARIGLHAAVEEISHLPRNGLWLSAFASASLAAAKLEDANAASALYPLMLPYADRIIVVPTPQPVVCYGSVSFYLALLAAVSTRWDEAERHFEAALFQHHRMAAGPFLARTRCEYAEMLTRRGRASDRDRASQLLEQAAAAAADLGLVSIAERTATLLRAISTNAATTSPRPSAESAGAAPPAAAKHVFRREGDYWTVVHDGSVVRLRDSKGLRCLCRLLAEPGKEILAVDLETLEGSVVQYATAQIGRGSGELELRADLGDAGELLDATARAEYKARLDDLREELAEAESFNDRERAARAAEEIEFLTSELARAVGLGGRGRKAASHSERARLNVTRAIRAALRNISEVHPALAEHLSHSIRTGRYCCYAPDPRAPIRWEI